MGGIQEVEYSEDEVSMDQDEDNEAYEDDEVEGVVEDEIIIMSGTESSDDMGSPTRKKKSGSSSAVVPQKKVCKTPEVQKNASSRRNNKEASTWILDGPGSQYDISPLMSWGDVRADGEGLIREDHITIKKSVEEEKQGLKEICDLIMPEVSDNLKYLTQEAIDWAKATPAARIEMTIRTAQRGNKAFYLLELRQQKLEQQVHELGEFPEESLLKMLGSRLTVERVQSEAAKLLEEREKLHQERGKGNILTPVLAALPPAPVGGVINRRKDLDFKQFHANIGLSRGAGTMDVRTLCSASSSDPISRAACRHSA